MTNFVRHIKMLFVEAHSKVTAPLICDGSDCVRLKTYARYDFKLNNFWKMSINCLGLDKQQLKLHRMPMQCRYKLLTLQ